MRQGQKGEGGERESEKVGASLAAIYTQGVRLSQLTRPCVFD
jgi:hypothetical protein